VYLSDPELAEIKSQIDVLQNTSFYHASKVTRKMIFILEKIVSSWPEDQIFPVLDLLRINLTHPEGNKTICNYGPFAGRETIFDKMAVFLSGSRFSSQMIALKFFTNGFAFSESKECVTFILDDVVEALKSCVSSEKKKVVHDNLVLLLINCCVYLSDKNQHHNVDKIFQIIAQVIQKETIVSDNHQIFNLLSAVGALIAGNNHNNKERVLSTPAICGIIDKFIPHEDSSIKGLAIEINNHLC